MEIKGRERLFKRVEEAAFGGRGKERQSRIIHSLRGEFKLKELLAVTAIANPFVQMSALFQKQANIIWYEIFDIVKQNCTTSFTDTPQDNAMELLLTARRKK